jgi:hypothetical protein
VQKAANHAELFSPSQSAGTVSLAKSTSLNQRLKATVMLFDLIPNMKYQHQITRAVPPLGTIHENTIKENNLTQQQTRVSKPFN